MPRNTVVGTTNSVSIPQHKPISKITHIPRCGARRMWDFLFLMAHKKHPKFVASLCFPLNKEELIWLNQHLNKSELVLFLYIAAINPYGTHLKAINPVEVMRELGMGKTMYYQSIAKLTELNLIDYVSVEAHVRPILSDEGIVRSSGIQFGRAESSSVERKTVRSSGKQSAQAENRVLEAMPEADSNSLRSIRSIRSLDPLEERESLFDENDEPIAEYRDWLIRRTQRFDKPVALIEDWLDHNATKQCNIKQFLKSKQKPTPQDRYSAAGQVVEKVDEESVEPFTKEFLFHQGCWNQRLLRKKALDWAEKHKDRVEVTEQGLKLLDDPSPT